MFNKFNSYKLSSITRHRSPDYTIDIFFRLDIFIAVKNISIHSIHDIILIKVIDCDFYDFACINNKQLQPQLCMRHLCGRTSDYMTMLRNSQAA